jgi:thiamine pyrophosphate-dependent acetolactate synthase large subunit-like protein
VDLVALAQVHGVRAFELETAGQLPPAVASGLARGGITVIVARTDRRTNVDVHDEIHAAVALALAEPLALALPAVPARQTS